MGGSREPTWGRFHTARVGKLEAAESSLLPATSASQLEYFNPWDGFPRKINVLSELILFLKGESHHIVKTDHKKMHQSVRRLVTMSV